MILRVAPTSFTQNNVTWKPIYDPHSEERMQIMLIDIRRVYLNAKTSEDDPVYVQLPSEAGESEDACALLRCHMYGTRRAAEGWQEECSTRLCGGGFTQGVLSPCAFTHRERSIAVSVHGDDFTAAGPKSQLDWFVGVLRGHYELTVGGPPMTWRQRSSTASSVGRMMVSKTKPTRGRPRKC